MGVGCSHDRGDDDRTCAAQNISPYPNANGQPFCAAQLRWSSPLSITVLGVQNSRLHPTLCFYSVYNTAGCILYRQSRVSRVSTVCFHYQAPNVPTKLHLERKLIGKFAPDHFILKILHD